jgi:hypothetical protein
MMARGWYSQTVNPSRLSAKPRLFRDLRFLFVIILSSALAVYGADLYRTHASARVENGLRLIGESAMNELQLRQTVESNHLLVYWAGPSQGSNYLLDTVEANAIVLTILPAGQRVKSTRTSYSQIGTYVMKNAFRTVLNGGNNSDVAGFINSDGNSVFYSNLDPKNVFIGIKGKDMEVQIFDPDQGTSLEIATSYGLLVPITKATG